MTSAQPLGDIRIVDFGLSRRVDIVSEVREILGTPEYVGESDLLHLQTSNPPAHSITAAKTDMWSLSAQYSDEEGWTESLCKTSETPNTIDLVVTPSVLENQ